MSKLRWWKVWKLSLVIGASSSALSSSSASLGGRAATALRDENGPHPNTTWSHRRKPPRLRSDVNLNLNFRRLLGPLDRQRRRRTRRGGDRNGDDGTLYASSSSPAGTPASPGRFPSLPPSPDLKEWEALESLRSSQSSRQPSYLQRRQRGGGNGRRRRRRNVFDDVLDSSTTSKLLATNAAVFLLQVVNPAITNLGAKISQQITSGRQLYRLVTPVFLHGGVSHLLMNSLSLGNIGPHVERLFGTKRFLATYLVSGAAGNLMSAAFSPMPSVGASGAIFGLVGAYYVFLKTNKAFFGRSGERGMAAMKQTIAMNVVFGLSNPRIDNWGHLGGALGGAAMAYAFGPRLYAVDVPGGRIVVDRPLVRMPRWARSLSEGFGVRWKRLKRKMQIDRYTADLQARPWRRR